MGDMLHIQSPSQLGSYYQHQAGDPDDPFAMLQAATYNEDPVLNGFGLHDFESNNYFAQDMLNFENLLSSTEIEYQVSANAPRASPNYQDSAPSMVETPYESSESICYSKDAQNMIPEHYGPGYWLSVCSAPAVAWIQQRAGSNDYAGMAIDLSESWAKHLRLERNERTLQSAEPDFEAAWNYSMAYLNRSVDAMLGVVHRSEYESHLRYHLQSRYSDDDPAWYALRNAVYASGCRLYHSTNHAANFSNIQDEAGSYFSNALSVHSELLLRRPSLRAVQALLAMALFAEGISSPALGSGLIANAAFLAQSLGLHRKVPAADSELDTEILQRQWLFWAVYCCEKNIARRMGRPSVIDDGDIGCEIPLAVQLGSSIDPVNVRHLFESCQISSRACKRLMLVRTTDCQSAQLIDTITDVDRQLSTWMESLPFAVQPKERLQQLEPSQGISSLAQVLLQCSHYDLLMVVHAPLAYPWTMERFEHNSDADPRARINAQLEQSSQAMAHAARNIIVMTRNFEINGANTHAFMLHYPMHAFVNLFVHILKYPTQKFARSDLALLDVAAGYFGQLEYITGSRLSFPFTRDMAAFARQLVDKHSSDLDAGSDVDVLYDGPTNR